MNVNISICLLAILAAAFLAASRGTGCVGTSKRESSNPAASSVVGFRSRPVSSTAAHCVCPTQHLSRAGRRQRRLITASLGSTPRPATICPVKLRAHQTVPSCLLGRFGPGPQHSFRALQARLENAASVNRSCAPVVLAHDWGKFQDGRKPGSSVRLAGLRGKCRLDAGDLWPR
jgi:hypothetical protein